VLVAADELDSLEETLALLSSPGSRQAFTQGKEDIANGDVLSSEDVARKLAIRAVREHQ
jgi:PHD/YefM family antitoxin component YafN of YafNO toxin-antitoxin module